MPAPIYIKIDRTFRVEILNGEMDQIVQQIQGLQENMRELRNRLRSRQDELDSLEQQLINMYVQSTGGLPS